VKGVTSAANLLIERGVADSARLGVHGTSYGGYAANLLITQTPRFKAAIKIPGKVDLVSFTWDSPRLRCGTSMRRRRARTGSGPRSGRRRRSTSRIPRCSTMSA
jgi:hypothetical protein